MAIVRRTQHGITTYNTDTGRYSVDAALTPIHYESEPGSGVFDLPINLELQHLTGPDYDVWQASAAGVHYAIGKPPDKATDGWVGFGGRSGAHWIKYRLVRIGAVHWPTRTWIDASGEPDYDRANLSADTHSVTFPGAPGEVFTPAVTATWSNVWTTPGGGAVDAVWRLDGRRLKEEVVINEAARTALASWVTAQLQARPAISPADVYLSLVFELDLSDIPRLQTVDGSAADATDFVDQVPLALRDDLNNLLAFMPLDNLIVRGTSGEETHTRLYRRLWIEGGKTYLLVGVSVITAAAMPSGALIFDPTIDTQVGGSYDDAHENAGAGTPIFYNAFTRLYAYSYTDAANGNYRCVGARWALSVPQGATITSAYLTVNVDGNDDANLDIYGEDVDNAADYNTTQAIYSRDRTTASAAWVSDSVGTGWQNSPDISDVVQEVVNRAGWSSGNYFNALLIPNTDTTKTLRLISYDGGAANAPKIHVEYTEAAAPQAFGGTTVVTMSRASGAALVSETGPRPQSFLLSPVVTLAQTNGADFGGESWRVLLDVGQDYAFSDALSDISGYVIDARWNIGLSTAYEEFGQPAMLYLTLNNAAGDWNLDDTGALYYGSVRRGMLVRIVAVDPCCNRMHTMYTGKISQVRYDPAEYGVRQVQVICEGPMNNLLSTEISIPLMLDATADQAITEIIRRGIAAWPYHRSWWQLGAAGSSELGVTTTLYNHEPLLDMETGATVIPFFGDYKGGEGTPGTAQTMLRNVVRAEVYGRFWWDARSEAYRFHNRHHDILNRTVEATITQDHILPPYDFSAQDDVYNYVQIEYEPRTVDASESVLWSYGSLPVKLSPGKPRTVSGGYRDADNSSTRIAAYTVQPVKPDFDIVANTEEGGTGENAIGSVSIQAEYNADGVTIKLLNTGSNDVWITALQVRGVGLRMFERATAESSDDESIRLYDRRTMRRTYGLIVSETMAESIARSLVMTYAAPTARFNTITINGGQDADTMAWSLALATGSRIAVQNDYTGHNHEYVIVGEQHGLSGGCCGDWMHTVTYSLQPTVNEVGWLLGVAGQSELGATTIVIL